MHSHDNVGRAYAKLSELRAGSNVIVDDSFTCMKPWSKHVVRADKSIDCDCGRHGLDGQLQDDGDTLIGVYHDA